MPTRNVVLTDHHESVIDGLVKSGRYQNASEVLREGLRMVEQRQKFESAQIDAMHQAAKIGFADLEQGRFIDVPDGELEDFIANLGQPARI